jgi:hypothetical protein
MTCVLSLHLRDLPISAVIRLNQARESSSWAFFVGKLPSSPELANI